MNAHSCRCAPWRTHASCFSHDCLNGWGSQPVNAFVVPILSTLLSFKRVRWLSTLRIGGFWKLEPSQRFSAVVSFAFKWQAPFCSWSQTLRNPEARALLPHRYQTSRISGFPEAWPELFSAVGGMAWFSQLYHVESSFAESPG